MPLSLEDQLAIQELTARYSHIADLGRGQGWADCFTENGLFEAGPKPSMRAAGRAELEAFALGMADRPFPTRHWTNNSVIKGEGEEATQLCYLMMFRVDAPPLPATLATYRDRLARVDGQWKFKERRLEFRAITAPGELQAERVRLSAAGS